MLDRDRGVDADTVLSRRRWAPQHSARRPWRCSRFAAAITAALLFGMTVLVYPFAAQWFDQWRQADVLMDVVVHTGTDGDDAREALANAEAYNAMLRGRALYAAGSHVPTVTGASPTGHEGDVLPYDEQLAADAKGLMARLQIPKIDLDLPVFHGTDHYTLLAGLGHLEGTALPVGGIGTRPVITGHRGLANSEMFTRLDELEDGDTFTIEVFGRVLAYRVVEKIVVEPDEDQAFLALPGRDLVTLVTCTPLGLNTHRILVTGERIVPTPQTAVEQLRNVTPEPGFPWWLVIYLGGLLAAGIYFHRAGFHPPPRRPAESISASPSPTTYSSR